MNKKKLNGKHKNRRGLFWKTFLLIPRAEIGSRQILLADKITNNFLILLSEYEYEYE